MQQLERKQQKPPRSSIPGRAREEQMPPKQMFKAWRSANDQICVVFQVTRGSRPTPAPPPSKDGRPGPRLSPAEMVPSELTFTSADGVIQQQLYPATQKVKRGRRGGGRRKRSNLEHTRAIVGLGDMARFSEQAWGD